MKTSDRFTMDLGWKLLSLAIAIGLWFMVINTQNPLETRSYTAAIQLQNEQALVERGYVVVNDDDISSTRITVRLRGQRLALDALSQSSTKVQAVVDLNNVINSYNGEPVSVPVSIVIPTTVNNSFEILSKSVQSVMIDIQPYINKDFTVEGVINYSDESVKSLANAEVSPATVTVYGAKSIVNSITSVKAEITPEKLENEMVITTSPKAYDANGNVVSKVTFSSNELSVKVTVDNMKTIRVASNIYGNPGEDYVASDISISPEYIFVAGNSDSLTGFSSIRLPDIDVTGMESNVARTFDISEYLPEGIRVVGSDGNTRTVTVTVTIEKKDTKSLSIPMDNVTDNNTLGDGLGYEIEGTGINVVVSGTSSDLDSLSADNIKAYVDLSGYDVGSYDDVPVKFDLPDGVTVKNTVTVNIVVS